jgi:hypothetical protein
MRLHTSPAKTPECFFGFSRGEVPENFPQTTGSKDAENESSIRSYEFGETSSYRAKVRDTIQAGEIGKRTVIRQFRFQLVNFLRRKTLDTDLRPGKIRCAFLRYGHHSRSGVARDDRDPAEGHVHCIDSCAAVDFQNTLPRQKYAIHFLPDGVSLSSADRRVRERLVVSFRECVERR